MKSIFPIFFALISTVSTARVLIPVGGNLKSSNDAIFSRIVTESGGRGIARIGILAAASEDAEGTANSYIVSIILRFLR